jgi:hypothetical protein
MASVLAAAVVAYEGIWQLSVAVAIPAGALLFALAKGWPRLQLGAQVFLILELLVLGGIWPSPATLAALIALPAPVLAVIYLVKRRSPRPGEVYILVCTLLASSCFLMQAIFLATRQH